jgi:hypothetical protein
MSQRARAQKSIPANSIVDVLGSAAHIRSVPVPD